jgi:2-acylglycerol O-acyltransferase 2
MFNPLSRYDIDILWVVTPLMLTYAVTMFVAPYKTDGQLWPEFQRLPIFQRLAKAFNWGITTEKELDHNQLYIFGLFPHGTSTFSHLMLMTDACGMLSKVYTGPRRDLAASVLFFIPLMREFILYLGNVDANSKTAAYNLARRRSLLIYIGGEKEQLMTKYGEQKIFLKSRKGFVKLAIQYGAHLVPMYAFGENELYYTYDILIGWRMWLQENFKIALCLTSGWLGTPLPLKTDLHVEIGAPIEVKMKEKSEITPEDIDKLHEKFINETKRLFDRTKAAHGMADKELIIL